MTIRQFRTQQLDTFGKTPVSFNREEAAGEESTLIGAIHVNPYVKGASMLIPMRNCPSVRSFVALGAVHSGARPGAGPREIF